MKPNNENPRLKEELRETYRSGMVSPYLAKRVIATVESQDRTSVRWLVYAGGLLSIVIVVLTLNSIRNKEIISEPQLASTTPIEREITLWAMPASIEAKIKVPSLSSLKNVPSLNRLQTPASSSYNVRDFCIYNNPGEMLC